jgi:hypothetical protein
MAELRRLVTHSVHLGSIEWQSAARFDSISIISLSSPSALRRCLLFIPSLLSVELFPNFLNRIEESMEESHPFLEESSHEFKQNLSIKWLKPSRRFSFKGLWSTNLTLIASHFAVFVATSCVWGAIIISMILFSPQTVESHVQSTGSHSHNISFFASETDFLTCGHSVEEAKLRGCQYDILTNHWMPGQCTDELSVKEYQSDGSWFPYADENRTELLAVEELGDRPFYYTSMRDHIVHCAVLWRRQFRALSEGWKYVDSITADAEHTMHCADFLMAKAELPDYREMPIKVFVGKSGCHVRDV